MIELAPGLHISYDNLPPALWAGANAAAVPKRVAKKADFILPDNSKIQMPTKNWKMVLRLPLLLTN
jgi:hypothetical protein